jgi:DNA-directed RNA polymerase specialized sigma subunit
MTRNDLRRKNERLRDQIAQVVEKDPELRDMTEGIALNQDLHVEVGAPFLERTRDKLRERARAIVERCPELEYYFDDPTLTDVASRADSSDIRVSRPKT